MPLRYLNLWYVMLGSEEDLARQGEQVPPGYSPTTEWRDFLAAVPLLEELYLRGQALKPNELPIFACMLPRLKLLVIRTIPFTGTEGVPDAADWRLAAQAITIQLEWYKMTADVSSITRYVYHIWPNVTFKTQFWAHTARMNEALRLLRLKDV
ncbi:hypothetical protein FRC08_000203 [Ceratobasidium sp. 394]|nr:hypothetical protein FRC08_000203 [Ceratobasidium sp. 394]